MNNLAASMESARFVYFDLRGMAEGVRLLLALNKIKFEDKRIDPFGGEWAELKKEAPLNQLPILEIDGMSLHQTKAICRYLARKIDLDGDNAVERVHIDIAGDVIYDLSLKLGSLKNIDSETARDKKFSEFEKKIIPVYLKTLDDMVKNGGGYFANGKLSWVDIYFTGAFDYIKILVKSDVGELFSNLKGLVDKVNALPELQEYLKFRPVSDF